MRFDVKNLNFRVLLHFALMAVKLEKKVPTINVLSKNKKKHHNFSSENYLFYCRENLQYITWACLCNELQEIMYFGQQFLLID